MKWFWIWMGLCFIVVPVVTWLLWPSSNGSTSRETLKRILDWVLFISITSVLVFLTALMWKESLKADFPALGLVFTFIAMVAEVKVVQDFRSRTKTKEAP